jgi:hypothetical protein
MRKLYVYLTAGLLLWAAGVGAMSYHVAKNPTSPVAQVMREALRKVGVYDPVSRLASETHPVSKAEKPPAPAVPPRYEKCLGQEPANPLVARKTEASPAVVPLATLPFDPEEVAPIVIPEPVPADPHPFIPEVYPSMANPPAPTEVALGPTEVPGSLPPRIMPYCTGGEYCTEVEQLPIAPTVVERIPAPREVRDQVPVERIPHPPLLVEEHEARYYHFEPIPRSTELVPCTQPPLPPTPGHQREQARERLKHFLQKLHRLYRPHQLGVDPAKSGIDTMEYRPSDGRLSDFGFGPLL